MEDAWACAATVPIQNVVLNVGVARRTVVKTKNPSHQCLLMSQCMRNLMAVFPPIPQMRL